jgi:5-methylcytosine-specific restriction endonuclease McrA
LTASILSGSWHVTTTAIEIAFAVAILATPVWFVVSVLRPQKRRVATPTAWQRAQQMDEGLTFRPPDDDPLNASPCGICDSSPNSWDHPCGVKVQVMRETYEDLGPYRWVNGRLYPEPPRWERKKRDWPKNRWCYIDVLKGGRGQCELCETVHPSRYRAEMCGYDRLRALQTGVIPYDQEYFDLADLEPVEGGPRTKRGWHPDGLPKPAWNALKRLHGAHCYYCKLKVDNLEREHRIPLSRGGSDHASNIVPACPSCNAAKGTKTDKEYFAYLAAKRQESERMTRTAVPEGHKLCTVCSKVLPASAFGKNKAKSDGLTRECRNCRNQALKASRRPALNNGNPPDSPQSE